MKKVRKHYAAEEKVAILRRQDGSTSTWQT